MSLDSAAEELLFSDSEPPESQRTSGLPWKIMLVDDDDEVHGVTRLALSDFEFDGRPLEFIAAHSGAEAKKLMAEHPDTAVMLLDVVMESEHAGLDVARYVREELENRHVRIVLRTGQPGQAPERSVIIDFDINDYKEKTELTTTKLFTLMYSSLRSFRDIMSIEHNRRGLEEVIAASADIFELRSMHRFAHGVLKQLVSLLNLGADAVYCRHPALAATHDNGTLDVIAATGDYQQFIGADARNCLEPSVVRRLEEAVNAGRNQFHEDCFIGYFGTTRGVQHVLYVTTSRPLNELDRGLIEVFGGNVGIAFENIHLKQEIEDTQREIVYQMGEAVETRSRESGNHLKRVAEYSRLLALHTGLSEAEAEIVALAAPLHDVGKVAVPDSVLLKPGELTEKEREVMKGHTLSGQEILGKSSRPVLRAGAIIAAEHHEQWDGQGYPSGKKGEEIHLYGRIVALADVFDTLSSDRPTHKSWPMEDVIDFIRKGRGTLFDPDLVDSLLSRFPQFVAIHDRYADRYSPLQQRGGSVDIEDRR